MSEEKKPGPGKRNKNRKQRMPAKPPVVDKSKRLAANAVQEGCEALAKGLVAFMAHRDNVDLLGFKKPEAKQSTRKKRNARRNNLAGKLKKVLGKFASTLERLAAMPPQSIIIQKQLATKKQMLVDKVAVHVSNLGDLIAKIVVVGGNNAIPPAPAQDNSPATPQVSAPVADDPAKKNEIANRKRLQKPQ